VLGMHEQIEQTADSPAAAPSDSSKPSPRSGL
jgi:hypothetical protein